MFKRQKRIFTGLWIFAAVIFITVPGCFGGGGKGLSGERFAMRDETASFSENARSAASVPTPPEEITLPGSEPSEHDPFGYLPPNWIDDCPLHPKSYVAHSGAYGPSGQFIMTLISPGQATGPGIQSYHIESLTGWESIQVIEYNEDDPDSERLTIIAERLDAELVIITEAAEPGFINTLDHADFWIDLVGPNPYVTRFFYMPLN